MIRNLTQRFPPCWNPASGLTVPSSSTGIPLRSQASAMDYRTRDVNVVPMSQFGMTAWVKRGTKEEAGVVTDFTLT